MSVKNIGRIIKETVKCIALSTDSEFRKYKVTSRNVKGRDLVILGNGPSLQKCMDEIKSYRNCDYLTVNLFPIKSEDFFEIKPKYHCMTDLCFFDENGTRGSDVVELKKTLKEKIDWSMELITPYGISHDISIENRNIERRFLNSNAHKFKITPFISKVMTQNILMPQSINVVISSIYAGIIMGYKRIYVYGIDMSFFKDFYVDDENHIVVYERHFYGEKKVDYTIQQQQMREKGILFVFETNALAFKGFKDIAKMAEFCDVDVINGTPGSYVDAFKKIKREKYNLSELDSKEVHK